MPKRPPETEAERKERVGRIEREMAEFLREEHRRRYPAQRLRLVPKTTGGL